VLLHDAVGDLASSGLAAHPGGFKVASSTGTGAYGWDFLFQ
jgi:hypothetical protein